MTILDIVILIILAFFFFKGFRMGLVKATGVLIGLIVGLWMAGRYFQVAADWLVGWGLPQAFGGAAGYIVIFIISVWAVSILVWMADRAFNFLAVIPGVKLLNNLLGGLLFLVEGVLIVGVALYVVGQFSSPQGSVGKAIENAKLAPLVRVVAWVASPLIPQSIESLKQVVPADKFMPTPEELQNYSGELRNNVIK